jgi:hypothetical protein
VNNIQRLTADIYDCGFQFISFKKKQAAELLRGLLLIYATTIIIEHE